MATETTLNWRQLVKLSASAAAGLIIASSASAQEAALAESYPTALALGYAEDASKVDTSKWTKKAGPDGQADVQQLLAVSAHR